MQNLENILPRISSVVTSPVISPKWCRQERISLAIRSEGSAFLIPFSAAFTEFNKPLTLQNDENC